jgi:hypothetical protein
VLSDATAEIALLLMLGGGRPRRLQRRDGHPPGLAGAGQHFPAAPYRQRQPRSPRRHGFPGTGQSGRDVRRPGAGGSRGMAVFRCCTWRVSLFKLLVYRIQESVESPGPGGLPRPDARIVPWLRK